jgi:hypothetical protein
MKKLEWFYHGFYWYLGIQQYKLSSMNHFKDRFMAILWLCSTGLFTGEEDLSAGTFNAKAENGCHLVSREYMSCLYNSLSLSYIHIWYGYIIYIYTPIYSVCMYVYIYIYVCMLAPHKTNVFPFLVLKVE